MTVTPLSRLTGDQVGGRPVVPGHGTRRPLGLAEIALTTGFWAQLQQTNAEATLAHCERWMERLGWITNFDRVADGTTSSDRPGWPFSDSEVYKLLEALAWEHGRTRDPAIDATLRRLTARVARAQDADGYLNTCYGHGTQLPRYADLGEGHELYCTGHLLQAAVARLRTSGPDELVAVAIRAADHVCKVFGPQGREAICGHPEIEVGLAELGRATGVQRYIEQAQLFVERRGNGLLGEHKWGRSYYQDDIPVREATIWRGHAVRALYLAAAAADVAVDTGDVELFAAVERQWTATVERRTYLTGGMGSHHQDEGFGDDWVLPPDRAYCETCAGIASAMVSWRLFLATGQARYADLAERTFYNVVATSPQEDGRAFFYANSLHQRVLGCSASVDEVNPRAEGAARAPWFDVSCCPTNVARTLASWHTYAAVVEPDGLTIVQHASAQLRTTLADGHAVAVDIETSYPDDGLVAVTVVQGPDVAWTVRLRVPAWAEGAEIEEGGVRRPVAPGFVAVRRTWAVGDQVRLHLPMTPRFTWPDTRIDAVRGSVAVEWGPRVLCLESTDLPAHVPFDAVRIDTSVQPRLVDGRVVVQTVVIGDPAPKGGWPYGEKAGTEVGERLEVSLVPYHQWAARGPSMMRVWVPDRKSVV